MPFSQRFFLAFVVMFIFFGCSRKRDALPFEFSAHHIKLQFAPESNILSVADTVSTRFHRNVDYVYFFLYDSFRVERVAIGNQELRIKPVDAAFIQALPPVRDELVPLIDCSQIVRIAIPKSLFPKHIEVWYRGVVDWRELGDVAWHPFLPGSKAVFDVTALLPQHLQPTAAIELSKLITGENWYLWRGVTHEPRQLLKFTLNEKEKANREMTTKELSR